MRNGEIFEAVLDNVLLEAIEIQFVQALLVRQPHIDLFDHAIHFLLGGQVELFIVFQKFGKFNRSQKLFAFDAFINEAGVLSRISNP